MYHIIYINPDDKEVERFSTGQRTMLISSGLCGKSMSERINIDDILLFAEKSNNQNAVRGKAMVRNVILSGKLSREEA